MNIDLQSPDKTLMHNSASQHIHHLLLDTCDLQDTLLLQCMHRGSFKGTTTSSWEPRKWRETGNLMEDWQSLKLKQNPDKKSVTSFFGGTLISEPFRFVGFFFFFGRLWGWKLDGLVVQEVQANFLGSNKFQTWRRPKAWQWCLLVDVLLPWLFRVYRGLYHPVMWGL